MTAHRPIRARGKSRALRLLEATATALFIVAMWSILGVVVSLGFGDTTSAWRFLWAMVGSGATLILIGLYQGRRNV